MDARDMLLAPLAALYGAGLALRDLYRVAHPLEPVHLGVPTIGVGNLSVGGTGKTSMVSWLASQLDLAGVRAAILSRGYRRPEAAHSPEIVSRGDGPIVPWERAGDEPWLLARRHSRTIVVVGRDRAAAGRAAVGELGADVLVLDDAFQHRRVQCDLNILMLDGARPPWNDHLLPWGRLREPPSAGRRADAAVHLVNGAGASGWSNRLHAADLGIAGWFEGRRRVRAVVANRDAGRYDPGMIAGRGVFLFSGIGEPKGFERTVAGLGARITGHHAFRDHHRYGDADLETVVHESRRSGADLILTTEKDAVRVPAFAGDVNLPVYYLEIELELDAELIVPGPRPRSVQLALRPGGSR